MGVISSRPYAIVDVILKSSASLQVPSEQPEQEPQTDKSVAAPTLSGFLFGMGADNGQ